MASNEKIEFDFNFDWLDKKNQSKLKIKLITYTT